MSNNSLLIIKALSDILHDLFTRILYSLLNIELEVDYELVITAVGYSLWCRDIEEEVNLFK